MKIFWLILFAWLALINLIAMCMTIADKRRAVKKRSRDRIPERTLLLTAFLGGAPLMFFTMLVIRHKTRHKKFMILLPLFCMLWAAVLLWLWLRPPFSY